jgi:hypothetical protein
LVGAIGRGDLQVALTKYLVNEILRGKILLDSFGLNQWIINNLTVRREEQDELSNRLSDLNTSSMVQFNLQPTIFQE